LRYFSLAFTEGFPENTFNEEKQQMAAVENGNGKQVEDTQVDAQDGDEKDDT